LSSPAGNETIALAVSGTQVTVTPSARLRNAIQYTLTVGTAVRGAAGEQVTAPITVAVTTEDGTWGAQTQVSTTTTTDSFAPRIAADATGGATVVWDQISGGGVFGLWASSKTATGSWTPPDPLGGTVNFNSYDLSVDANGNAFVVWFEVAAPPLGVWATRHAAGGTWSAAGTIEASTPGGTLPVVATDANGNAIAIWSRSQRLWSNRYTNGSGWGTEEPVITSNMVNINTRFAGSDAAGNAVLVWDSGLAGQTQVNQARYVAGTGWAPFAPLPTSGTGVPGAPEVVVDAAGDAIAVWDQNDGVRSNLWASRFTPAQGWSTAVSIETTDENAAISSLATDDAGNVVATWIQFDGTRNSIWANRFQPGSGWATAEALETSDAEATNSVAGVDAGGNAHVAWVQSGGVWVNRYVQGIGWRGATSLAPGGDQPRLAVSKSGRAFITYTRTGNAAQRAIQVREFD
jgi:hypothetical protein